MLKSICITILLAMIATVSSETADPKLLTQEEVNAEWRKFELEYFEKHLSECPKTQIRCLWFNDDRVGVGKVMTIDLRQRTVYTARHMYHRGRQAVQTRPLDPYRVDAAAELLYELPTSDPEASFADGLHIAYWLEDKLHIATYDKSAAPFAMRQLYVIGGGARTFVTEVAAH